MLEEGVGANSQQRPMLDGVNTSKKHLRKRDGHRTIRHSQDDHRVASASPAVRAVNALTTRWCAQLDGEDFALSGAGVWPLLVLLASAADEQARTELTAALEVPADQAMSDALELLDGLQEGGSIAAAMSIWVHKDIPLHKDWAAERPPGVVGELTDQATLDQWAADATKGLITRFPADITADTEMIIASALAARVRWRTPFHSFLRRDGAGEANGQQWLARTTPDLAAAAILDGAVTRIAVEGEGDVDVHLLLGDRQPAQVLATGLRELSGEARVCPATELHSGAGALGLKVRIEQSSSPKDRLNLELPSFDISTRHDLLKHRDLFGLRSVTDSGDSHLPLLSPVHLFLSRGTQ